MEFKRIDSKDNELIKKIAKLSQKKYRDESGLFVVENPKIFFDSSEIEPEYLFLTDEFWRGHQVESVKKYANIVNLVFPEVLAKMSNLESNVGFLAVYKKKKTVLDLQKPIIYLNGINDPGNLGTILRSAVAFDFINVITDETCADIYGHKTVQAAKDAIFKLNFAFDKKQTVLQEFVKNNLKIIGAEIKEKSLKLSDFNWPRNFCLVLGSESSGLTEDVKNYLTESVEIEISSKMESLNVGVSAGIIFYKIKNS